jgi:hypothetical protein
LEKRSTITVKHILKVVTRRYLKGPTWLPDGRAAALFFAEPSMSTRAKVQVAFLYTVAEDMLVQACLENLVLSHGHPLKGEYLHLDDVLTFLKILAADHPEVAHWQPYLRRRWSSGFLSLLRDAGFLEPATSSHLVDPVILPEAFCFIFLWLVEFTGSVRAALAHVVLKWWSLDPIEQSKLLATGVDRGWWRYAAAGSVIEFQPLRCMGHVQTHAMG